MTDEAEAKPSELEETEDGRDSPKNVDEDKQEEEEVKAEEKGNFTLLQRRSSSSDSDKEGCNVHVVCRVRPLNIQELERGDVSSTQFPGEGSILVDNQGKTKNFSFHGTFEPGCTQSQVFDNCSMRHLLDMALDGYACTAFAFGQTGSGKTYTMTGPVTPENRKMSQEHSVTDADSYGLIQYSFAYLMDAIAKKHDASFSIRASYLEIYNEQVQDLLNSSGFDMVQVRWSRSMGFYVENLFVKEIESLDDLLEVLEEGMSNRVVAEHNVNEHSSRSHSILTVYLDSEMVSDDLSVTKHGKVSFVDLAGSEKVKDTGSTGDTLIEATNINRSLLTLGNCISALSDPKKRNGHIPFRDSKLTKLLADGLGGSGITLMIMDELEDIKVDESCWCSCHDLNEIACITPSSFNLSETLNTLRYAKRAKKIKNKPIVRIDPREEFILKLQREMKLLRQENRFLRDQLEFPHREKPRFPLPNTADGFQKRIQRDETSLIAKEPPQIPAAPGKSNSSMMNNSSMMTSPPERALSDNSLYEMLQEYMVENEALRNENQNLISQHNLDEREQRLIVGENDKLARKLEDLSRLMMSSPLYGSSFFSRTTSGRSNQSYQTWSASLTPLSQTFYPYQAKSFAYEMGAKPPNAPMMAWNSTPSIKQPNGLPPLRQSPKVHKQDVFPHRSIPRDPARSPPTKWVKGSTYASQFKRKLTLKQGPGKPVKIEKPPVKDVLQDFPMRDYDPNRTKNFFLPHHVSSSVSTEDEEGGHMSSLRNSSNANYLPANLHVRFGKSGFYHIQNQATGGALPDEAYKPQEISKRGTRTKELSATSLRKLNDRMRQEMQALDEEINSYQKAMATQQTKKKLTAT